MKYCSSCGQPVEIKVPPGDHQPRHVCGVCGTIHYHNPKVIVGCVPEDAEGRILMCRRAIEPRLGMWTFPAGFLELNETTSQGAAREALEESQAEVDVGELFAVINVPYVSQIYMIHRARLLNAHHGPTHESSETQMMREDQIPWDRIAFPTIYHSLKFFFGDRAQGTRGFHQLDLSRHTPRPG